MIRAVREIAQRIQIRTRLENINLAMIWGGPVINREAVIFYDTSCKMWGIP